MIKVGDWALIARGRFSPFGGEHFEVIQVGRVTAKMVHGEAHYRKSHDIHLATVCKDEASARLICERLKSAGAERDRRRSEADKAFKAEVVRLLASAT